MENRNAVAIRETAVATSVPGELSVEQVLAQAEKIQVLMQKAMKPDEHYGIIPGTERKDKDGKNVTKPTLLKAGAEKLCFMFRLDPQYSIREIAEGPHLTIISTCTLYHIPTGARMGSGMGSCSTRESKYAYRKAERTCPACHKDTIIKGRAEYGGGWLCFAKKGGCGAKYSDGDQAIEGQQVGRIDNPDIADQYNTVLKMSNKRSLCAAVLNVTAASDIFTQDLEDLKDARESLAPEAETVVETTATAVPAEEDPRKRRRATAEAAKTQAEAKVAAKGKVEAMTPDQSFELEEFLKQSRDRDATEQGICEQFKIARLEQMNTAQANHVLAIFKRKMAKLGKEAA